MALGTDDRDRYGPEAYAPDGTLWWRLRHKPGSTKSRFGDERKLAAYLACHIGPGNVFSMRMLRDGLGDAMERNTAEHLNRRLRELRLRDGWRIPSQKDDATLAQDEYRVEVVGWHPGTGAPRPVKDVPSDRTRRLVFERDKLTCQICHTMAGEPYIDLPEKIMRPTLGHRIPGKRLTRKATPEELQTECARCNESIRDELFDPITLVELLPRITRMKRASKERLLAWLEMGHRSKDSEELAYADARRLTAGERELLREELQRMVGSAS